MQMQTPLLQAGLANAMPPDLRVRLPGGQEIGPPSAAVQVDLKRWSSMASLRAGEVGALAQDYVEGRLELAGSMRDIMAAMVRLLPGSPLPDRASRWTALRQHLQSLAAHSPDRDAAQIRFHYDICDDFYALWLDARRVYSCAYYRDASMTLAQAQEAKLDHICRKLMLQPGERFLDIGAGWGALLLWAAEHYGVDATGITLSRDQYAHVNRLIRERGLAQRVRMELMDYRQLDAAPPYDKVSSVGMFEHVGQSQMRAYFGTVRRLLKPGGLVLNHGITAGGTGQQPLRCGLGDFIERYIFPGGELLHVSTVLGDMADAGLEMLDTENLRPHYARTLWAWSDALEAQLPQAHALLAASVEPERARKILRAYRLYLAGCAVGFEQGWISLHQVLAARPSGDMTSGALPGSQTPYPFRRDYMYGRGQPSAH